MSTALCPICNRLVSLKNINIHLDSNCKSFVHVQRKNSKKLIKSQSGLGQYFHAKQHKSTNEKSNSKKRKRQENTDKSQSELAQKRRKLMNASSDESEQCKFESFQCQNKSCMPLSKFDTLIPTNDMEYCVYFDQRIVGQKFCANKKYETYALHRTDSTNTNRQYYLDFIHEFDNNFDTNAIIIAQCHTNTNNNNSNKAIIALGYLPKTMSECVCDLLTQSHIEISVYKQEKDRIRIHICALSQSAQIMDKIKNLKAQLSAVSNSTDLYFEIVSHMFVSSLNKYSHLFDAAELTVLNKLIALTDKKETSEAIQILSRLLLRKAKWFKISALAYPEINDIKTAVSILIENGILVQSQNCAISEDLLHCIGKNALVTLCNKTGLRTRQNGTKCGQLIQSVMSGIATQKTMFGTTLANDPTFVKKCHAIIGEFVAIHSFAMRLLNKCQLLFYLSPHKSIKDTVLSQIGVTKYPKYEVGNSECKSETVIFPTKHVFAKYANALQFRAEYDQMYVQFSQNKSNESEIIHKINECAQTLAELLKHKSNIHSFVSSYRDIAVYGRALHRGVTDVFEKLSPKRYEHCCEMYQTLLLSQPYSYKRGKWFCRLALLLHSHLKRDRTAYTVCSDALSDNYVQMSDRNEIIKRYAKLHKKLDLKHQIIIPEMPKFSCFALLNKGQCLIDSKQFKYVMIGGKAVNCRSGEKSRFFGFDDSIVSVEGLVLQYFEDCENGNWNGIHCEGSLYRMIFTIFMFDLIFAKGISYVFQTKYQNAPLDMNTEWFYANRKEMIERHINQVLSGLSDTQIEQIVRQIYLEHFGECVIGVCWDRFELADFVQMCQSMGGYAIGQICLLLAKNYSFWSGGLPDLFLWRQKGSGDGDGFECKIVEVKGARDRLSEKQNCWILYLKECAKLDVCVAKIKEEF